MRQLSEPGPTFLDRGEGAAPLNPLQYLRPHGRRPYR